MDLLIVDGSGRMRETKEIIEKKRKKVTNVVPTTGPVFDPKALLDKRVVKTTKILNTKIKGSDGSNIFNAWGITLMSMIGFLILFFMVCWVARMLKRNYCCKNCYSSYTYCGCCPCCKRP